MKNLLILLLVAMCQIGIADFQIQKQLQLEVYYESKCPDTMEFVRSQLVPAVNTLHRSLRVKFIPFGKARSITVESYGQQQIHFQCQHGPSECLGNKVQDCALSMMEGRSDQEKTAYVACEMDRIEGARGSYWCVQNAGINVGRVKQCVNSNEGTQLQLVSERATKLLRPNWIPSITVNGRFNQRTQDSAMRDLIGTLCSMMPNAPPCAKVYNDQALRYLLGYNDYRV